VYTLAVICFENCKGWSKITLFANQTLLGLCAVIGTTALSSFLCSPAWAQASSATVVQERAAETANTQIAESVNRTVVPPPNILPTDFTPIGPRRNQSGLFAESTKFRLFQSMPSRMFFNCSTEVSQRLDTNCLFTYNNPQANYAFRVLPNVTLGYNVLRNTGVYCNYFMIKDVFSRFASSLNQPTMQSLALGVRHVVNVGRSTNIVADFQSRELWQAEGLRQADLIPSINVVHSVTPSSAVFGGLLLQMRGKDFFGGASREIDPFYTIGAVHRRGQWTFVTSDTLVTNFRGRNAIPNTGNVTMVADFEVSRPIARALPSTRMFVRAEPVWNWSSHKVAGLSGFDFRLYGGIRVSADKPAYTASIDKLRKQIHELNESAEQVADLSENESI
jgi:hypothetical protein